MAKKICGSVALIVAESECGLCRRLKEGTAAAADETWAEGFAIAVRTVAVGVAALCRRHDDMIAKKLSALGLSLSIAPNGQARDKTQ